MANGFDPFAQFSTPEFGQLDLYTRWLRFNESFPSHPAYNQAGTGVREQMRNQVLGVESSDELYRGVFNILETQGADTVTKNQVFNGLVTDDEIYENWELEDKRAFRKGIAGTMDPEKEGYRTQAYIPRTFTPEMAGGAPEGEGLPARSMEPPTLVEAVENLTAIAAREQQQKVAAAQAQQKEIMEKIFLRKVAGSDKGAEVAQSVLDIPLVQDIVAPWINRAIAIPGELSKNMAQVADETAQARRAFGETADALKRVRLRAEGQEIPQELAERKPENLRDGELIFDFAKELMDWGVEYGDLAREMAPQRTVQTIEEIDSPFKLLAWGAGTVSDMGAFMTQVMAGKAVAGGPGALIATAIPSIAEVSDEIYRETGGEIHGELAIPLGLAIAGLEKFGFEQVTKGMTRPIRGKIKSVVLGRTLAMLQGGTVEAGTEPTQELITIISGRLAGGEKEAWEALSPDDKSRIVNAAWTGLVGGLMLSGGGGAYNQYMSREEAEQAEAMREALGPQLEAVEDLVRLAMKMGPPSEMVEQGKRLVEAARTTAVGMELEAEEAEVAAATQEGQKRKARASAAELVPDILTFIKRNPVLQELINTRDPESIAQRLGVSEEEAAEIINAFAEEEAAPETVPAELFDVPETGGATILDAEGQPVRTAGLEVTPEILDAQGQPVQFEDVVTEPVSGEEQAAIDEETVTKEAEEEERLRVVQVAAARGAVKTAIQDGQDTVRKIAKSTGISLADVRLYANDLSEREEIEKQGAGSTTDPFRYVPPGTEVAAEAQPLALPVVAEDEEAPVSIDAEIEQKLDEVGVRYIPGDPTSRWEERNEEGEWNEVSNKRVLARTGFKPRRLTSYRAGVWEVWNEGQAQQQAAPVAQQPEAVPRVTDLPDSAGMIGGRTFAETAIPQLESKILDLQRTLNDSEAFGQSEWYDGTYPIPERGGINAARGTEQYRTDPGYRAKVDVAIEAINDTMVAANRQRMILLGDPTGNARGLSYQSNAELPRQKATAKYSQDVNKAWASMAKDVYGDQYLGNISVREVLQNSLDAVLDGLEAGLIKIGKINIDVGEPDYVGESKSFSVEDNGPGMTDLDIADKFLTLHASGKDKPGRFGGFGIAKAVILMPHKTAKWVLKTLDNFVDSDMTRNEERIGTLDEPIKGTRIEVETEHDIINKDAVKYVETTEFPDNVEARFNGKKVKDPFANKVASESYTEVVDGDTTLTISFYKKAPKGYERQQILRLVDPATGAKLTQGITRVYGFEGAVVIDVETTSHPSLDNYPLNGARTDLTWNAAGKVREHKDNMTEKPFEDIADLDPNKPMNIRVIGDRSEWKNTLKRLPTDPGYLRLMRVINEIYEETGQFFGHAKLGGPITPPVLMDIWIDKGYKGKRSGSMMHAKHLAAYEAVLRLFANHSGTEVQEFHALLSENVYAHYGRDKDGNRVTGLNPTMISPSSLEGVYQYFAFITDLANHELTHFYVMDHNVDFTSSMFDRVQQQTSSLLPYVIRIAEAMTGESATVTKTETVEKEVIVEVPVEKIRKVYIGEQLELELGPASEDAGGGEDYIPPSKEYIGGSDGELYYPTRPADGSGQRNLFRRRRDVGDVAVDSTPPATEDRGGTGQPDTPGTAGRGAGGVRTREERPDRGVPGGEERGAAAAPDTATGRRLQRKADRYRGLIEAAKTTEQLDAVVKQWDAEKSKPWWVGIDDEIAARRALLVSETRPEETTARRVKAPEPPPKVDRRRRAPPTAEETARVADEASAAQRAVWDAVKGSAATAEVGRAITEGIGEDGFTARALADADPEIATALENPDVATATAILQGKAEAYRKFHGEKPLRKRKPRVAAPKAEPKQAAPKKKVKAPKKEKLNKTQQEVLDSITTGLVTITEVTEATGIPRRTVRESFHALARAGKVTLGRQDKEEGGFRFVATLVTEPEAQAEAKKEYAVATKERKEEKKKEKEEEKATKETAYERVKREYEAAPSPRSEEMAARKADSERGSVRLVDEKQEDKNDEEARKERSLWARKGFRDYVVRGGRIFSTGQGKDLKIQPRGKMSKGQRIAWNELVAMIEAAVKQGHADRKMIDNHIAAITRNPDKVAAIGKVVTEFLQGELKTTGEVADIIHVPKDSQFMVDIEAARQRNSDRHARLMESEILPQRIKMLLADREFYLRRAYERFLRDKRVVGRWRRHVPTEADKKEAADLVNSQYSKQIQNLSKQVFTAQEALPEGFDFGGFLEGTNDGELLGQLDGGVADRLLDLRNQIQRWEDGITTFEAETGRTFIVENADAVQDMATQMVEVLISDPALSLKQGGRLKIGNLKRRMLVDVFRKLYGEVYDPAILQALTVEAQGTLIAQSIFFQQMAKNGHNLVWSNGPDIVPGLTEKLGNRSNEEDVFRYGELTGKYVDPLFKDFLDRKGLKDAGIDELLDFSTADPGMLAKYVGGGFQKLQGVTRQFALTSVGAWTRNFVSSYAQFAMQSGDVFLKDFNKEFFKGVKTAMLAIGGNEQAMRQISDDMEKGAFRYTQTSLLQDLAPTLKTGRHVSDPETLGWQALQKVKSLPQKLKESYILIDYAAKKAAFEARFNKAKKLGKTDAVANQYAKEHVAKFYQNAERVPELIQALSKYGLTDFAGFKYDSGRMAVNATINVGVSIGMGKEAEDGTRLHEWMGILNEHPDLVDAWEPLVGFSAARVFGLFGGLWGPGQYLFMFGTTGKLMSMIGATLMSAFQYHDDDDEHEEMTAEESAAMNEILPIYDANSQRWEYRTKNKKTGKKQFTIVPLGSQFGNYVEEAMIGIVQRMSIGHETPAEILNSYLEAENVGEVIPMGMTMSNLWELATGYDPQTSRRQPSIAGAMDKVPSPKVSQDELLEALGNFLADTTGSFGRSYKRWQTSEDRAGRTPQMGTYLKEVAEEPAGAFLEWMGPLIRPLRPIDLDEHEVIRRMGYKWSEAAYGIMLDKTLIGTPERKKNQLGESTLDEQAMAQDAEARYQSGMRRLSARIQKAKPVFDYLGIHEEQVIGRLRSVKSSNMQLSQKEIDAIVYDKVDEYIDGEDYYEPDPTITPDQKGETQMRVWLAKNPHMTQREIWNMLKEKKYLVSDSDTMDAKFLQRYKKIKKEMLEKRRNGYF